MLITLISIFTALGISLVSTPVARKIAIRFNIYASPNHRTVHKSSTPKLGGLSIFIAFAIGLLFYTFFTKEFDIPGGLLIGGGLVLCVGLIDDLYHLSCYTKLVCQTIAAAIAVYFGFVIETIYTPAGSSIELGYWAWPLTIFWIISITNAVNLLDGLDGLASGFGIIVTLFVLLAAALLQNTIMTAIALILVASSLGFLRYNFNPARIFMGDMGSLFLGYVLACLSLKVFVLPDSGSHLAVLMVLFLIPLTDTALAILRRVMNGQHPFSPDKKHIHHRLLELGFKQTSAVLIIYAATLLCGIFSLVLFVADVNVAIFLISVIVLLALLALVQLRSFDFLNKKEYFRELG